MKNYHLLAAVALIAMAGCSQNEITDVSPDANPVVGFDIYTGGQTKGLITNTDGNGVTATGIQTTGFGILAYYTGQTAWDASGSFTPNFMWNQQVTYNDAWIYTPVKYWPNTTGDKVSFFAYAPYSSDQASTGSETFGIKLPANTATAKPTIEFKLDDNAKDMVDLVAGFQKDQEKRTAAVGFDLKHLLSRVEFKAKLDASISGGATHVFITGMRILGKDNYGTNGNQAGGNSSSKFYEKATYDWSAGVWDHDNSAPTAKQNEYAIDGDVLNLTGVTAGNYSETAIEVAQAGDKTTLFKPNQYLFLIPPTDDADLTAAGGITSATDVRVQIDYDIVTVDTELGEGFLKTSTKATVSLNNGTLKRGKAYEYLLTIGLTKVEVSAEVTAWESSTEEAIPSVDADATLEAIKGAITAMNTAKGSNPNCNYFVVNIADGYDFNTAGALNLSAGATVTNFVSGDKIELNFKSSSSTGSVTVPSGGWTATLALTSEVGKVILTKD